MIRLPGAEGRDVRDQIAFCAFHSFLVEVQTNAGYIMWRMRNNNLEIRIADSSCRLQLLVLLGFCCIPAFVDLIGLQVFVPDKKKQKTSNNQHNCQTHYST